MFLCCHLERYTIKIQHTACSRLVFHTHPEKKEFSATASPPFESLQFSNNPKKNSISKKLNIDRMDAVKAVHSVGANSNGSFRAAVLNVYQDQSCWYTLTAKSFEQNMMYKDILYMADKIEEVAKEQGVPIKRLESMLIHRFDSQHSFVI
ncbi:hypothetical protein BDB01DRAFT_834743 [Pilobolus umbonatus]|nr:hypothetical protein BDB01DRAFT_834743 [Pilobolus umbonatus]